MRSDLEVQRSAPRFTRLALLTLAAIFFSACTQLEKPQPDTFLAENPPPVKQEFRWSNGKSVRSFDPAKASAAPETDAVRAIYEGLTEIDPQTLEPLPAIAESWASDDDRVWTFKLRKDAKWSDGRSVTANDLVRSWYRLAELGDSVAYRELISNIEGFERQSGNEGESAAKDFTAGLLRSTEPAANKPAADDVNSNSEMIIPALPQTTGQEKPSASPKDEKKIQGVTAPDAATLIVRLVMPDPDLPRLVANPMFFPVADHEGQFANIADADKLVTNGPFDIASSVNGELVLERSNTYWNRANVQLEKVHMMSKPSAEAALNAYRAGEIDALTNADFEPLALKLLTPYDDFKQTVHGALNFYEINTRSAPYSDRRVREALSISIDRDRLVEGELQGTMLPANRFLPLGSSDADKLIFDAAKAKDLLGKAGYPNGDGFPAIRLVINRNDVQQRVAKTVARMWKQNLNLDTDIIVKDQSELETIKNAGDYDLMRRGVVMPSIDEMVSLRSILGKISRSAGEHSPSIRDTETPHTSNDSALQTAAPATPETAAQNSERSAKDFELLTEADAVYDMTAVPLYFPSSYSLVKPYVKGFLNSDLDTVSLGRVSIDSSWKPALDGK